MTWAVTLVNHRELATLVVHAGRAPGLAMTCLHQRDQSAQESNIEDEPAGGKPLSAARVHNRTEDGRQDAAGIGEIPDGIRQANDAWEPNGQTDGEDTL